MGLYDVFDLIRISTVFAGYILLPGLLLVRLLFARQEFDRFEQIWIAFCLGVSLHAFSGFFLHLMGLSIDNSLYFYTAVMAVLLWLNTKMGISIRWNWPFNLKERLLNQNLVILIVVLGMLAVSLWTGASLYWQTDAYAHLANTREVYESGLVIPPDPHRPELPQMPNLGLWSYVVGQVIALSNTDLLPAWDILSALMVPFLLIGVYGFSKQLFQNKSLAVVSMLFFLIIYGNWFFLEALYPNRVNFLFMFASMTCFLNYMRDGQNKFLILGVMFGVTTLMIHAIEYIQLALAIIWFVIAYLIFTQNSRKTVLLRATAFGILTILASAPYLLVKFPGEIAHVGQVLSQMIQIYATGAFGGETTSSLAITPVQPTVDCGTSTLLLITSILPTIVLVILTILLPIQQRHKVWMTFLLGNVLGYWLLPQIPGVSDFLSAATMGFIPRRLLDFSWLVLAYYVYILGIAAFTLGQTKSWIYRAANMAGVLFLMLPVITSHLPSMVAAYNPSELYNRKFLQSPLAWQTALQFIDNQLDGRATILADPATSYVIPTFTKHHVVENWPSHRNRYGLDYQERIYLQRTFFTDPQQTSEDARALLDTYEVDYIVVNLSDWIWDPIFPGANFFNNYTLPFLRQNPDFFEEIYADEFIYVFKYTKDSEITDFVGKDSITDFPIQAGVPQQDVSQQNIISAGNHWEYQHEVNTKLTEELTMLGYTLDKKSVSPGDRLSLTLYWQWSPQAMSSTRLIGISQSNSQVVLLSTMHPYPGWNSPFLKKPLRKLQEQIQGQAYYTNQFHLLPDHNPVNGQPWLPNEVIIQEVSVQIPAGGRPGNYQLWVQAEPFQCYRSQPFIERLLLEDRERYASVQIGSLQVEP